MTTLFTPIQVGDMQLANRIVMAPLTRNRAPNATPTPLMIEYYTQRATAGLLITEATAISQQGQGYSDVPGLYGSEQLQGWKKITDSVHAGGSKMVVQLWHVGRVSHTDLQPENAAPVAPSAITANTKTVLIQDGVPVFVATSEPRALLADELPSIVQTYRTAAHDAIETAGFDGVEIHAANGYLLDQFFKNWQQPTHRRFRRQHRKPCPPVARHCAQRDRHHRRWPHRYSAVARDTRQRRPRHRSAAAF
jgi:N-ethylmaleimide reductase